MDVIERERESKEEEEKIGVGAVWVLGWECVRGVTRRTENECC